MQKLLSARCNVSHILLNQYTVLKDITLSYRLPFYHLRQDNRVEPVTTNQLDIESGNSLHYQLTTLYKHCPAANPKFFNGSFLMNLIGLFMQLSVFLFLNQNAEKDSDASGILTTLPKNNNDILACATVLFTKDLLLNMIEIGSFQKAHLSKHTVDYLSAFSFACMRTSNFFRFPNYLHQQKVVESIANLSLHTTSLLSGFFFFLSVLNSLDYKNNLVFLNVTQKKLAKISNGLFAIGALTVCFSSGLNIASFATQKDIVSIQSATAMGASRMLLFIGANYIARNLYKSLSNSF